MTAPIVLFVYNRLDNTKMTIAYLQKNILAKDSDLIIYSDGAKNESNQKEVDLVRDFCTTIDGFKSVTIHKSPKNNGLAKSIITGVTETVNRYGSVIVLEDDLISSPYFLTYMNDALEVYKDNEEVISIHGFFYPTKAKLPETFFLKGADCWGWATWKRGWDLFESDGQILLDEIVQKDLVYDFDFKNSYGYFQMLKDQIAGKNNSWAIRWYASAFLKNKYTLYPGKPLIGNIGMNDGTHCKGGKNIVNLYNDRINVHPKKIISQDVKGYKAAISYFRVGQTSYLRFMYRYLRRTVKEFLDPRGNGIGDI